VLRDISDLKHATLELEAQFNRSVAAEHRARAESERMNVIIENAGVPILVTDRQTRIVLMNREAERLFGSTAGGATTSPRTKDIRTNDAKLAGLINDFLLQAQQRREAELALVDPDRAREFPARAVSRKTS
jgi:PAS domain-containing protein